ncbi:phosphohistidine phosphatase SixA [Tautonia sociabilis]|uniref:Phosphohistidine phosphatase SixA n=1 Tax=Tautonia sociabilis TaxID=2080755 RepID=A0A432MJ16_9BACT|nr:phosphohistidine phosphatase SixA [Tautonia sociabilis]RUL87353.1 phosphohistidine phosphatase SixA [Tautonia sociabilis]
MRTLYVLRHGIALPSGTPSVEEGERPLTPKGRRRMEQVAQGLKAMRIQPDRIVTSPLPRAEQTAEIVAKALGLADRVERDEALLAHQSAAAIRSWLSGQEGEEVMIVGHNPAFSELVTVLPMGDDAPPICALKKGGLACFAVEGPGVYRLDWLAPPRLLRRIRR